jgi:hypothetical protein
VKGKRGKPIAGIVSDHDGPTAAGSARHDLYGASPAGRAIDYRSRSPLPHPDDGTVGFWGWPRETSFPLLAAASLCDDGKSRNALMATSTITVDPVLKARITDLAGRAGQDVDAFVEALLRRLADADVRFERGVPTFPPREGAPTLTVDDVDRLAQG